MRDSEEIQFHQFVQIWGIVVSCLVIPLFSADMKTNSIEFKTDLLRWEVNPEGKSLIFQDKKNGKDYLAKESPSFASILKDNRRIPVSISSQSGDLVNLTFGSSAEQVDLRVISKPHYLVFEIVSVSDPTIEEVTFAVVRLDLPGRASSMSGVAAGDTFAVSVRALNLQATLQLHGGSQPLLCPAASKKRGFIGTRVAGVGCPPEQVRPILQEVIRSEGLAISPLGGPFALDAEENRGSYVFATVSEANVDAWIALAKKAGLAQIHLIGWEKSLGTYQPRVDLYPHGIDGLKQVVDKIHAAGLRAGMHTLTGGIARDDPLVTPLPDSRLAKDGWFTLAADIQDGDDSIHLKEPPGDLEISWQYSGRSNVVQIGDELIQYAGLSQVSPYGLTQCTRGAFGTRRSAHKMDSAVRHLFAIYGTFQPDEESTLVDEVAERIAHVFNTCRFDMIYQDGAEGMPGGPYGWARMREAIFRRLQGRVLVEASEWGYLSWPYHSRLGAYDHPNWGLKRFIDIHCRDSEEYQASSLLTAQLGWWSILGPNEDHPSEFPDELEYLCVKSLAYDMPMSFQGIDIGSQPWNARQDEYLEMIGRHERLRLQRAIPEAVRTKLRSPRQDFHLRQDQDGRWQFYPTHYLSHRIEDRSDSSRTWTINNPFSAQPLRIRLEALYSAVPPTDSLAIHLAKWDPAKPESVSSMAGGIAATWDISKDGGREGEPCGLFGAQNNGSSPRGSWACIRKTFEPPIDISSCGALGVWIYGDGKGELLNFQLSNPDRFWPTWDEHYVDVDFEGWKYFELHLRERDADRFVDYSWPYGGTSAVFRSPLIRSNTSSLSIYYNNLPVGDPVQCRIGPVVAVPVRKVKISDPSLEMNGSKIVFPIVLESGQYLELESLDRCTIFDERGTRLSSITPKGDVPIFKPGDNRVNFSCVAPEGFQARTKVTIILMDDGKVQ